jgi:Xaa-Pro aminopeptidase
VKQDLDRLMKERGIDALTVSGTPKTSRDMYYLTGPITVTGARVVKKRGEAGRSGSQENSSKRERESNVSAETKAHFASPGPGPVLIVGSMERDEAAKGFLEVKTWNDFDVMKITREAKGPLEGSVKSFLKICEVLGISGTVAFYGTGDIPYAYSFLDALAKEGSIKVHAEAYDSIFSEARMTKDNSEIDRIDSVSRRAQEVMAVVRDFLSTCSDKGGKIVDPQGEEVTIGRVKKMILKETKARSMLLEEAVIFSQGRDSAVPHSRGDDSATLVPGKTIVFDYCPQEGTRGYFCDISRTWCPGFVPDEVKEIYDQVLEIQLKAVDALEVGGLCSDYDKLTNEYFDKHGHPTPMKETGKTEGYVHGLGHGIGLNIHERPRVSMFSKTEERLAPGHVFTVEPGLYYPEREIGVRIEDDIAIKEDGTIVNLTTFPKGILVPLK